MEFELCKENIQPLRGGRNRAQLEVALQAQDNEELQKELSQQRQEFEFLINSYEGDDPLNNWYSYISWVEQSYPKHGHEGNLLIVLEDCLGKFENDQRYIHDRRMCKLWIKYIDLQQNPDELYQLLHSKGICVSCADLYRAWAFYHEIAGDYKRANAIYQLGMQNLAQPYEELEQAQKNMFMAAGRQILTQEMSDQIHQQREEQRHALTSLRSYKHKTVVPSRRTGQQVLRRTPGALPQLSDNSSKHNSSRSNKMVTVYSDDNKEGAFGGYSGTTIKSVLEVARRKEIVKENTLKPGPWTVLKPKKKSCLTHLTPNFKVHEDDVLQSTTKKHEDIKLYPDFCPANLDDFSDWKVLLCTPDPDDPTKIPMYPKQLVYCQHTEFSLEEIKARRYEKNLESRRNQNQFEIIANLNKFAIFEDETDSYQSQNDKISYKNKRDSSNFEIFQDDGPSCSQTYENKPSTSRQENFSSSSKKSVSKSALSNPNKHHEQNRFTIFCEDTDQRPKKSSLKSSLFGATEKSRGFGASSSHKEDHSSSHLRESRFLGKKKTVVNSEVNEYVRNLIAKLPVQENTTDFIKLDKNLNGEGPSNL